jgi:hypothetical protein
MTKVTVDTKDLKHFEESLSRYGQVMPTATTNRILSKATKVMLNAARIQAPVSKGGRTRISLKHRSAGKNAGAYAQGGATRRDLRIKVVPPGAGESGRVLVGVSKRSSKVGWRTKFITHGTKDRKTKKGVSRGRVKANNFLQRAYDLTFPTVKVDVEREFRLQFIKWARENMPQK